PVKGPTNTDVIAAIVKSEPPLLTRYATEIPAELERIVTKTLRKDREERFQAVKELALDLKSLKQRLEFESQLERTAAPERDGQDASSTNIVKLSETATAGRPRLPLAQQLTLILDQVPST